MVVFGNHILVVVKAALGEDIPVGFKNVSIWPTQRCDGCIRIAILWRRTIILGWWRPVIRTWWGRSVTVLRRRWSVVWAWRRVAVLLALARVI